MSAVGWIPAEFGAPPSVLAGVTTRLGGVSSGGYESLNLAAHVGDDDHCVRRNRELLRAQLGLPAEPVWLQQVHGIRVHTDVPGQSPAQSCDAAVTFHPNRVLAVLTADCLPVIFASRDGQRLGVAHAGWRGLCAGVLEATVAALAAPPEDLMAWMGPAIGPRAFEVGEEVRTAFLEADESDADGFTSNSRGRWQADLGFLAQRRLQRCGVGQVTASGLCTYSDPARFYSYRRDAGSGRMATLVWRRA